MVNTSLPMLGLGPAGDNCHPRGLPEGWKMIFPVFCTAHAPSETLDLLLTESAKEKHPRSDYAIITSAERPNSKSPSNSPISSPPVQPFQTPFMHKTTEQVYQIFKSSIRRADQYDTTSTNYWSWHTFMIIDDITVNSTLNPISNVDYQPSLLLCTDESGTLETIRTTFDISLFQGAAFELEASSVAYIQYMFADLATGILSQRAYNGANGKPKQGRILEYTAYNGRRYEMLMEEGSPEEELEAAGTTDDHDREDGTVLAGQTQRMTGLVRLVGEDKWRAPVGEMKRVSEWEENLRAQGYDIPGKHDGESKGAKVHDEL